MKKIRSEKTALALMGLVYPLALCSLFLAPLAAPQCLN